MTDGEWEAFFNGLAWGVVLVFSLVRYELWLQRRHQVRPVPVDPFDTLRWDVLAAARQATREGATGAAE